MQYVQWEPLCYSQTLEMIIYVEVKVHSKRRARILEANYMNYIHQIDALLAH